MSRTDKEKPAWTRVADNDVTLWAHHTRECLNGGKCTLPRGKPEVKRRQGWKAWTKCYWVPLEQIGKRSKRRGTNLKSFCGCPMCTGRFFRQEENRKIRRSKRQQITEQLDD